MPDPAAVAPFLCESHRALADRITAFVREKVDPLPAPADDAAARTQARGILKLLGEGGWLGYAVPAAFGGASEKPDLRACALVREALAGASPLADAVFALQCLGSMPITLAGSDEQRKKWLSAVAKGEAMAAFAMTEPQAGSDVSGISTTARREGDFYVLTGHKVFISNAGIADFYVVFASTDLAKGTKGISCFLVEAANPGLRFARAQVLSAPHPLGEITFSRCKVPLSALIGQEGEGFKIGMGTLDRLRATVAAAACGMAERALAEALRHAASRRQFGKPLADFQMVQEKLAVMATELAASRLLVYRAAMLADTSTERVTMESAMAKAYATEAAQRVIDQAVQVLGGAGVMADHPVDRLYRAVRALRIYEGTTEIQHVVIARHLLKTLEGRKA